MAAPPSALGPRAGASRESWWPVGVAGGGAGA
eukprot:CAMPEP_0185167326 /NCGR_PEP_ID=MMETSP1139-20130426/14060_1 /TAXON_ID=298111 /ORGANISM="Pavlova sp., Strain CCMP459" /LENGTH=31 /DNA_ID= /DNA_START= /DNA_END= /DNA_ORIENTATION=